MPTLYLLQTLHNNAVTSTAEASTELTNKSCCLCAVSDEFRPVQQSHQHLLEHPLSRGERTRRSEACTKFCSRIWVYLL